MACPTKNKNVDIFVYGVKAFTPLVTDPVYKIIVHSDDDEKDFVTNLKIYRDFEGENIADKNLMYNEYTGLYWAWKNLDLKDYVGCNHYRRYFDFKDDVPDINKLFNSHSIILNKKFPLEYNGTHRTNREFYKIWHNVEDFDLMGSIVKDLYPEFEKGWDRMAESSYIYPSSIFIMRRSMFEDYMQYIFDVTEEFCDAIGCNTPDEFVKHVTDNKEKYIREEHKYYDINMQSRIIGYLIERCLCAFLMSGGRSIESRSIEMPWKVYSVKYNK